ncbi:MAG: MCE family protein [Planctomycetota bacterium]|nr:MAG: MCE family protein [Planctomycetota bacterium]
MSEYPQATWRPRRRVHPLWVLPILTLLACFVVAGLWYQQRGVLISIHFPEGHGIEAGAALTYRGIQVGSVERVAILPQDQQGIEVRVRLDGRAHYLAAEGSDFWIVRPRFELAGIDGLDTVIGARYVAVRPGSGPAVNHFTGLAEAPVAPYEHPDGLRVRLEAGQRGGLHPGAPVLYRQVPIGRVTDIALASDGASVVVHAHVQAQYRNLVRENTVFWNVSGVDFQFGIRGLRLGVESVATLLTGAIALATPPQPGDTAGESQLFPLHAKAQDEWLEWRPALGQYSHDTLTQLPLMLPIRSSWQERSWRSGGMMRNHSEQGWVLQYGDAIIGLASLLSRSDARRQISFGDTSQVLSRAEVTKLGPDVVQHPMDTAEMASAPRVTIVTGSTTTDVVVVKDNASTPLNLSQQRLRHAPETQRWYIDSQVRLGTQWHGAAVLNQSDGALRGFVSSQDTQYIALITHTPDSLGAGGN